MQRYELDSWEHPGKAVHPERKRASMTETADRALSQALDLVDNGLSDLQSRELVSASQVADMLLDLRLLLLELDTPDSEPALLP